MHSERRRNIWSSTKIFINTFTDRKAFIPHTLGVKEALLGLLRQGIGRVCKQTKKEYKKPAAVEVSPATHFFLYLQIRRSESPPSVEISQCGCGRDADACVRARTGLALCRGCNRPSNPGDDRVGWVEVPSLGRAVEVAVGPLGGLGRRCVGEGSSDRGVAAAPHQYLRRPRLTHQFQEYFTSRLCWSTLS